MTGLALCNGCWFGGWYLVWNAAGNDRGVYYRQQVFAQGGRKKIPANEGGNMLRQIPGCALGQARMGVIRYISCFLQLKLQVIGAIRFVNSGHMFGIPENMGHRIRKKRNDRLNQARRVSEEK